MLLVTLLCRVTNKPLPLLKEKISGWLRIRFGQLNVPYLFYTPESKTGTRLGKYMLYTGYY